MRWSTFRLSNVILLAINLPVNELLLYSSQAFSYCQGTSFRAMVICGSFKKKGLKSGLYFSSDCASRNAFDKFKSGNTAAELSLVSCPLAVIYGERSALFPPEIVQYMSRVLTKSSRVIALPGLHHHLFLEQPKVFVNTLRNLLEEWRPKRNSSMDKSIAGRVTPVRACGRTE